VDANRQQNFLLELKSAAIRALDHEGAFELFGAGRSDRAAELYQAARAHLGPEAQRFWDRRWRVFATGEARGGSFYYMGTAGFCALGLRSGLEALGLGPTLRRLLEAPDLDTQRRLYESELRERLLRSCLFSLMGRSAGMALLGVPAAQRGLVARHPGGLEGYLGACLARVMSVALLRENYFWRVYLTGSYAPTSCPRYLEPMGFAGLKAGLLDGVTSATATVAGHLERSQERFTAFVLLDHMDWMAHDAALLSDEWRQIFAHAAPGARVIFRSAAPDAGFLPGAVSERLDFDVERASALHALDRVATYGSFHVARIAA